MFVLFVLQVIAAHIQRMYSVIPSSLTFPIVAGLHLDIML